MDDAEYEGRVAIMNEWSETVRQELAKLISENPREGHISLHGWTWTNRHD